MSTPICNGGLRTNTSLRKPPLGSFAPVFLSLLMLLFRAGTPSANTEPSWGVVNRGVEAPHQCLGTQSSNKGCTVIGTRWEAEACRSSRTTLPLQCSLTGRAELTPPSLPEGVVTPPVVPKVGLLAKSIPLGGKGQHTFRCIVPRPCKSRRVGTRVPGGLISWSDRFTGPNFRPSAGGLAILRHGR